MTSTTRTESDLATNDHTRISYLSGDWIPHSGMRIAVDDAGFRQGVVAVERLRTYSGHVFSIDAHLERWQHSTNELGIAGLPASADLKRLIAELLARNASFVRSDGDIGVTMFATPGESQRGTATFGLHLNRLNHAQIRHRREQGQPLVVTDVIQPDPGCWPRTIKTRSRIHYYRADSVAKEHHADAIGVLVDDDGSVTETSIANLAIIESDQMISPPADRVLGGITQSVIESLAVEAGIRWKKQPVSVAMLVRADEILMMGTDGGIWFANSVNGRSIGNGKPGQVYLRLRERFDRLVNR